MSKTESAAPKNEQESVLEWLQKQGYPLEMAVANAFRETGYKVSQAEYYVDPESGKAREIDVVAEIDVPIKRHVRGIRVTLVIECKMAPKPWVFFSSQPAEVRPLSKFDALANGTGQKLLSNRTEIVALPEGGLLNGPATVAHAVTVAFRTSVDEPDQAYRASVTVARAAKYRASKPAPFSYSMLQQREEWAILTLPMIVLGGALYSASLASNGKLVVEKVQRARLALKNPDLGHAVTFIDVIGQEVLASNALAFLEEVKAIAAFCEEHSEILTERALGARRRVQEIARGGSLEGSEEQT